MTKTKLDQNDLQHQHLIALMAQFVDWGYHPRELIELLDHAKSQLYFSLVEIYEDNHERGIYK